MLAVGSKRSSSSCLSTTCLLIRCRMSLCNPLLRVLVRLQSSTERQSETSVCTLWSGSLTETQKSPSAAHESLFSACSCCRRPQRSVSPSWVWYEEQCASLLSPLCSAAAKLQCQGVSTEHSRRPPRREAANTVQKMTCLHHGNTLMGLSDTECSRKGLNSKGPHWSVSVFLFVIYVFIICANQDLEG